MPSFLMRHRVRLSLSSHPVSVLFLIKIVASFCLDGIFSCCLRHNVFNPYSDQGGLNQVQTVFILVTNVSMQRRFW